MRKNIFYKGIVIAIAGMLSFQCSEPHSRFDTPEWLGGTNIETLDEQENYSIFIELMDKADYRVSIENQLFTLFVPNDSSFEAYFEEIGISTVDELSVKAAEELFGQHILINPRARDQLIYEYAWGELQDPNGEYGALFHRKETYAVPLDYTESVRYNKQFKDQDLLIYRRNTMIPLFTTEFFEDYFGDTQGADYTFIYPGSSWSGTQWHDAMVTNAEVRTGSGFIYYIDRVVEPVHTIETYLKENQDEYGIFYDIAQRFASYGSSVTNENNERAYRKSYGQISDFANENGPDANYPASMLYSFSAFVPNDIVLGEYLNSTVLQNYSSIDSVPQMYLVYLLQSHLNSYLMLPSKIEDRFQNFYGDRIDIDINNDIRTAQMCGNGVIYDMNKVIEPNAFTCVPGDIFLNPDYTTFLYALEVSGLMNTLSRTDIDMTLFAAPNSLLEFYGITHTVVENEISIKIRNSVGDWEDMLLEDIQKFVRDFIHEGRIDDLSGEGYLRMDSDNYIYYNDNKVSGGGNIVARDNALVTEKIESKNGNLYYLNNSIKAPRNAAEEIIETFDFTEFKSLLEEAALISYVQDVYEEEGIKFPRLTFMSGSDQWTLFAPSNAAVVSARNAGLIPTERDELRKFIYYHFVRGTTIFDNGELSGTYPTHSIDTIIDNDVFYKTLDIINASENLSVEDLSGSAVNVDHTSANVLIENGVLHKISSILQAEGTK